MAKAAINWDDVPQALLRERSVQVCLKCGFDLMTRQMGLAARTAYTEMRKFVPASSNFQGRMDRPLFQSSKRKTRCPYCDAANRWVTTIRKIEIDEHRDARKPIRALLASIKKKPAEYSILKEARSSVEVFSDWLERTSSDLDFESEDWPLEAARAFLQRREPSADWSDIHDIKRIQLSRRTENDWEKVGSRIFVSPSLYGDLLVVQYLLSKTHLHGALTFEGRLTLFEFFHRLRRLGYLESKSIQADDPSTMLESAIASIAGEGDIKPHLVIDRTAYLDQLKGLYDGMKK